MLCCIISGGVAAMRRAGDIASPHAAKKVKSSMAGKNGIFIEKESWRGDGQLSLLAAL